jgi:hypothetical protein
MDGLIGWLARAGRVVVLGVALVLGTTNSAAAEPAQVTFSGFQRGRSGDGTLFVHVSQQAPFSVKSEGSRVTVRLEGATIDVRNNRHPLDLSHFNVLLLESRLVAVGGDVELQLQLRRPANLDVTWVRRKDGLVSLHVAIPPA